MKKCILGFGIIAFTSLTSFGQTAKKADFTFCNTGGESISLPELQACRNLQTNLKDVKIKSFTCSIFMPDASAKDGGVYVDYRCIGNRLTDAAIEAIKKADQKSKVLIEEIICIEGGIEKKYPGIVVTIR